MKRWNLTVEENEARLEKLAKNEALKITVGCDTGIRKTLDCHENHKKYHTGSGYITKCKICDLALGKLEIFNVYSFEFEKIIRIVYAKEAREELEHAIKQVDAEMALTQRNEEAKVQRRENAKNGKTVVHIEKNTENGTWRIIGGENGRLERSVFFSALNEMNAAFSATAKGNTQILNAAIQPEKSGIFDLETEHFVYEIVSEVFEE